MLLCANGAFYTGWTINPERRFRTHLSGKGASYTKMYKPLALAYIEEVASRRAAMLREIEIKKYPHQKKLKMAEGWLAAQAEKKADQE